MEKRTKAGIPVVGFAGFSGSGKTTLIEKVVQIFKSRGIRTAIIKHDAHRLELDHEGKDTWRFAQAGADITIAASPGKTAYIEQRERPLDELLEMVHDVDLILVEGFKNHALPQIGICRAQNGKGFAHDVGRYLAVVSDSPAEANCPCFDLNDAQGVADLIEKTILHST